MTNTEMKPNRFARWHLARKRIAFIRKHLAAGNTVAISTQTRAVHYTAKHINMFKATRSGAYVQRGKSWDCIDFCSVTAQA